MEAGVIALRNNNVDERVITFVEEFWEMRSRHFSDAGPYGLCLSSEGDLLSQWRGYADDAFGFSIGFDTAIQIQALEGWLTPVAYAKTDREKVFADTISAIAPHLSSEVLEAMSISEPHRQEYLASKEIHGSTEMGLQAVFNLVQDDFSAVDNALEDLAIHRFALKGEGFSEEKEWRIVGHDNNKSADGYHARRDRLVPFIEFPLVEGGIDTVILGPKNNTPKGVVESIVGRYGKHANIKSSIATYR